MRNPIYLFILSKLVQFSISCKIKFHIISLTLIIDTRGRFLESPGNLRARNYIFKSKSQEKKGVFWPLMKSILFR